MISGLTPLEVGRLRMSLGYGTHKKGRPLSPVEVGGLLKRALDNGTSLEECAKVLKLKGTSQLSRFLQVSDLAPDLVHLVAWGRSAGTIGFTTAVEIARVPDPNGQRAVAAAVLEHGLKTDEVRQVAQISRRARRPVESCVKDVLAMRPTVERLYVFMGAMVDTEMQSSLARLSQSERDELLSAALRAVGLRAAGRLGERLFTIVGDDAFNVALNREGRETTEASIRAHIARHLPNG